MNSIHEGTYRVIKYVASPLRFFAVVVIALVGLIIMLAWISTLPPDLTFILIIASGTLLTIIIAIVIGLVIFSPKKLVFDQEAHLTMLREQLGDNELPILDVLPHVTITELITDDTDDRE